MTAYPKRIPDEERRVSPTLGRYERTASVAEVFLIFGLKSTDRRIGSRVMACEICGVTAAQVLTRRSTKVSLFFIPLFPVKPAAHYLHCTNCGSVRRAQQRVLSAW